MMLEPLVRAFARDDDSLDRVAAAPGRPAGRRRRLPDLGPDFEALWRVVSGAQGGRIDVSKISRPDVEPGARGSQGLPARHGRPRRRAALGEGRDSAVPRGRRGRTGQDAGRSRRHRQSHRPALGRRRPHRCRLHLLQRADRSTEPGPSTGRATTPITTSPTG